jgi:hypothetical protein
MICQLCQLPIKENDDVLVELHAKDCRTLTRTFTLCQKCSCCLTELFIKNDKMNKFCNSEVGA